MVLALYKGPEHPTKLTLFFKIYKFKFKKKEKKVCVDFFSATLIFFFWERRYQDTVDFVGLDPSPNCFTINV